MKKYASDFDNGNYTIYAEDGDSVIRFSVNDQEIKSFFTKHGNAEREREMTTAEVIMMGKSIGHDLCQWKISEPNHTALKLFSTDERIVAFVSKISDTPGSSRADLVMRAWNRDEMGLASHYISLVARAGI